MGSASRNLFPLRAIYNASTSITCCLQWAFPFAKPVDVNLFKQYPVIIQHPMDFATIKAKVDGGVYKGPHLFYDDMKLVFANARRFNPPGSDVYLMASGVEVSPHLDICHPCYWSWLCLVHTVSGQVQPAVHCRFVYCSTVWVMTQSCSHAWQGTACRL